MHISSFGTTDAGRYDPTPDRHRARDSFGYVLWDTTLNYHVPPTRRQHFDRQSHVHLPSTRYCNVASCV